MTARAWRMLLTMTAVLLAMLLMTASASAATATVWAGQQRPANLPAACSSPFALAGAAAGSCRVQTWTAADYRGTWRGNVELSGGVNTCPRCQSMISTMSLTAYTWGPGWRLDPISYQSSLTNPSPTIAWADRYAADWSWVWFQGRWRAVQARNLIVVRTYVW